MPALAMYLPVSDETIRALCWTLIHSLWEGALLAVSAAAVLLLTRKRSADLRYRMLVFLYAAFAFCVGATFYQVWNHDIQALENQVFVAEGVSSAEQHWLNIPATGSTPAGHYLDTIAGFCNAQAPIIVALWLLVFLLKCLRLTLELRLIHGLRRHGTVKPTSEWHHKVRSLATRLHIPFPVTLLESTRVQVPATIGFWKPVILVPLGLLTQLPPAQVEAVLLHELAHIRRRDFLVNLLQHFMDTLFFFNPAVLWVSALLRDEREHCCDDIAVAVLKNKSDYLHALMSFEQLQTPAPAYAPAFPGREGQLLQRVKRIIGIGNTKTFSNMEKITLIITVLCIGALAFYPVNPVRAQVVSDTQPPVIRQMNVEGAGTVSAPYRITIKDAAGKTYSLNRVGNQVTDLQVDGVAVPASRMNEYDWLVNALDDAIAQAEADRKQAELDKEQAERDAVQAKKDKEQAERDAVQAKKDREQAELDAVQAKRDQEQAELDARQAKRDQEQAGLDAAQAKLDQQQAERDAQQAMLDKKQAERDMEQARRDRLQAEMDRKQAKRDVEQAKRDAEQAKRDVEQAKRDVEQAKRDAEQAKLDAQQAKKDHEMVDNLISDLIRDNLVRDKSQLRSFQLTDKGMEVNGEKQPAAVSDRYKAKYLKKKDYSIYYGLPNARGTGIFINERQ